MLGTATRRSKIRKNWFFDCSCPRCSDPTELGTFASALLCPVCVKGGCEGVLLPKEPLNPACLWTCSLPGCSSQTESSTVRDMVANFEKDLETAGESVEDLETLLVTLGQTLHPQHYLMMTGKRRLLASLHIASSQPGPPPSRLLLQQIVIIVLITIITMIIPRSTALTPPTPTDCRSGRRELESLRSPRPRTNGVEGENASVQERPEDDPGKDGPARGEDKQGGVSRRDCCCDEKRETCVEMF